MAPTLYMLAASPPVRAVLLCAKAIGLDLNLKEVDLFTEEHLTPEYLKMNPQHTVPTLVDDDGFILWDSHAIMSYLIGKYGKDTSLYPADLKKRAIIDQRLHFDSNLLFVQGRILSRKVLFEGATEIKEDQLTGLREAFQLAEKFLENNKWVAGNELSIADFSFVTSISSWSVFEPVNESKYPRLTSWLKQMEKLPYYEEANKPGLEAYKSFIHSKLS